MKDCTKPVKDHTRLWSAQVWNSYSSTIWDPALQTHITALEQVQRRAARYVCNEYHSRTPGCVTKMIDDLNWEPLEVRRRHERLCMLYRIYHYLVDILIERYLQVSDSNTRNPPNSSKRGFQMLHIPTPSFQDQCGIGDGVCSIPGGIQITPLGVICSTRTAHQWQCTKF